MNKSEFVSKAFALMVKYKYLVIVIVVGIILLLLPDFSGGEDKVSPSTDTVMFSVENEERRISKALETAEGLGKTEVILTLNTTMETLYQNDFKEDTQDSDNASELSLTSETVIIAVGSGQQQAVVTKRIYPEYRGALVICEGATSSAVKLQVINAVKALTGLSSDKITVINRKS